MFVSNVTRIGCEVESPDVRLPRIFYVLSIKTTTEQYITEESSSAEWSEVYVSEVLTDSTLEEWQPLGKNLFPLGLPRMRAQDSMKLDVYECRPGEERDPYPMILEAGGRLEERVESALGRWTIRFSGGSRPPDIEVIYDDGIRGRLKLFLDMRDGSRVYLVSPVVCVLGKKMGQFGKKQMLTLNNLQEHVVAIHDLQRTWQHESQVCLQRKALCMERYPIPDDVDSEYFDSQKAQYYILQQRKMDMIRSIDKDSSSIEEIRSKQKVKLQALLSTVQALVQAAGKVRSKKLALEGVGGQGTVDAMGQQVEARRAMILTEIRKMYHVVCTVGHPKDGGEEPQVESTMELKWSGMESSSLPEQKDTLERSYSIRSCRIHDSTWKYAFDKDSHHYDDPDADRETRVALGYIAHMIVKISEYMNIPLRYPVSFRGSYSIIRDNYSSTRGEKPREFPLYCESPKDRPKYAIAVFLLNKDIIQILAHVSFLRDPTQQNLDSLVQNSPNHIAQNLYNLLTFYDPLGHHEY